MKDYLNKDERVQLLFFKKYIDTAEQIIDEWGKKNNLSKEETKALKTSKTWGLKAYESICKRMNDSAAKTFLNIIKSSYLNIENKYMNEIYERKIKSDFKACYEENKEYYRLVELILHYNCRNCQKYCGQCEIYREFEEHCIPELGKEDNSKCKYAYKKE